MARVAKQSEKYRKTARDLAPLGRKSASVEQPIEYIRRMAALLKTEIGTLGQTVEEFDQLQTSILPRVRTDKASHQGKSLSQIRRLKAVK